MNNISINYFLIKKYFLMLKDNNIYFEDIFKYLF